MPEYSQADRALQVKSPLGEGRLLLAALRGREAVSELFEFHLHLLAPNDLPPVTFAELMGCPMTATVRLPAGNERKIHGVVMALRQEGRDREFTHFRATLRPVWWTSTLRVNSRIFQQKSAPEILRELLRGVPAEWRLAGEYPRRDFCCQYQETDFAFASRLMEEEGIFYFFKHAEDAHTLVLADGVAECPGVPGAGRVRFDDSEAARRDHREPLVWRWEKVQEVCATKVTVWDSHFELFGENLAAEAGVPERVRAGRAEHAPEAAALGPVPVYLHEGDYAKRYDGFSPAGDPQPLALQGVYADAERTAGIRAEQAAARSVRAEGESDACYLTPGHSFELSGHFDADGGYLVTRVEHEVELKGAFWAQGGAGGADYRNRFEASPLGLVPRPARRTPRPKVGGPLTAVVVGPPGEEIFVDAYGRVKVQFFWDREGRYDAGSSCWIRVAQLWAGKRWGAFFWPRVGMEVVVHFEDGDIDRPVITGCVYNGANLPPLELPAQATVGGVKSLIFGGDPATQFNAIYIHDTPDVEYIAIHSETHEVQDSESHRMYYAPGATIQFHGSL